MGYAYRCGGLLPESLALSEQALAIDPSFRLMNTVVLTRLCLGQYQTFLDKTTMLSDTAYVRFYRGLAPYYLKDFTQAQTEFERAYALNPKQLQACVGKALSYGLAQQMAAGMELVKQAENKMEAHGLSNAEGFYRLAQAYAA